MRTYTFKEFGAMKRVDRQLKELSRLLNDSMERPDRAADNIKAIHAMIGEANLNRAMKRTGKGAAALIATATAGIAAFAVAAPMFSPEVAVPTMAGAAAKGVALKGEGMILVGMVITCFVAAFSVIILNAMGYKSVSQVVTFAAICIVLIQTIALFQKLLDSMTVYLKG